MKYLNILNQEYWRHLAINRYNDSSSVYIEEKSNLQKYLYRKATSFFRVNVHINSY